MEGRHGADLALAGVEGEPAPARLGDAVLDAEQRLRRRAAETDKDVGIGKFDLAQDEAAGRFAIPAASACDFPAAARARCWRCRPMCGRGRSPPACGRAICRSGRRTAGLRCLRRGRALRRRTSPVPSGCRRRRQVAWRSPSGRSRRICREWRAARRAFLRFLPPRAPPSRPRRGRVGRGRPRGFGLECRRR